MQIVIKIPEKEFGIDIEDKFQDFFKRLEVEIKDHVISETNLVCGAYELETIDMFLKAFSNSILLPKSHRFIDADEILNHAFITEGEEGDTFTKKYYCIEKEVMDKALVLFDTLEADKE